MPNKYCWFAIALGLVAGSCKDAAPEPTPPAVEVAPGSAARPARLEAGDAALKLDIDRVDAVRYVVDDQVLVAVAIEAAVGTLGFTRASAGLSVATIGGESILVDLDLTAGDVIQSVNDIAIAAANDLPALHAAVQRSGDVDLSIVRAGTPLRRRYVLRSSLAPDRTRVPSTPEPDPARARVVAALATGVKETAPGTYDIDARFLATIAAEPRLLDEARLNRSLSSRGLRVVSTGTAYAALGISSFDTIKAVNHVDVTRSSGFADELGKQREVARFTVSLVRLREPLIFEYRVVVNLLMDSELDEAVAAWKLTRRERPTRTRPGRLSSADLPDYKSSIAKIADDSYEIERALVDTLLSEPATIARQARVVPRIKDGKSAGFKLFAIRSNSVYSALGLKNGDNIISINGLPLTTPDSALSAYTKVRSATKISVDIERRGRPVTLHYRIKQ